MAVRVLAFFDTRYQSTPAVLNMYGTRDPWERLRNARPQNRQHGPLNWPSTLGTYDLCQMEQAAAVVETAAQAGLSGFVVDCRATGDRYLTGADALAPATNSSFGLAFRWDVSDDPFWQEPAAAESRKVRAEALVSALTVGSVVQVEGKLILVVDRPERLSEPTQAIEILREAAALAGLPGLYLIAVQANAQDSLAVGYDAALDPDPACWAGSCAPQNRPTGFNYLEIRMGWRDVLEQLDKGYDYTAFVISRMKDRSRRGKVLPRVFPAFQDWASHPEGGATLLLPGSGTPGGGLQRHFYGLFLENAMVYAHDNFPASEELVFLQSWNGWLENSQIEPSLLDGDIIYDATREAITKGHFLVSAKGPKP
ncbi:glycoside hydrolase family 99-like domain-containing protein [Telmatospirillum sp.]|uniref:glycoside hydrolase family 99-like domain-containing protein n=1 Tax=Telmatospirillum sp. TaxID=2079197 RepID=UPI002849449C|nr:glycoside hydrolase family 99-like domain-containing protein [Telmatospirillum sp.]MDR3441310.1 glycoside hydrolase family 99-like domain-containing protein [Telmatospirillum sp.]